MKQDFLIFLDFSRKLWTNRYMLKLMTDRELKTKYIGSLFGLAWAVINPISQVAIYGVVFGYIFHMKPGPGYGTDSFLLFLMCGLVPWQFFSQCITGSAGTIVSNSTLIKKAVGFPSEILPIVTILSFVVSHLIGVAILLSLAIIMNGGLSPWALLIFVYIFFMVLFSVGLGWILSSLSVYLKDLRQVLGLIMMAWLYFTPIFYSAKSFPADIRWLLQLNPMFHTVEGYRLTILAGKPPELSGFIYMALVSAVIFALGGICFRRLKPGFADVI